MMAQNQDRGGAKILEAHPLDAGVLLPEPPAELQGWRLTPIRQVSSYGLLCLLV